LHLHDYVDGEIGADHTGSALREIIHGHLALCPRCARLEHQLRAFRLRLRTLGARVNEQPDEQPSPEFRARIARLLAG
jgi:anti-sigma factor RsiW